MSFYNDLRNLWLPYGLKTVKKYFSDFQADSGHRVQSILGGPIFLCLIFPIQSTPIFLVPWVKNFEIFFLTQSPNTQIVFQNRVNAYTPIYSYLHPDTPIYTWLHLTGVCTPFYSYLHLNTQEYKEFLKFSVFLADFSKFYT